MKLIGNLLILVCVIFGSLSAASAYLTPIDDLQGRVPRTPAGVIERSTEDLDVLREQYAAGDITADELGASVGALREKYNQGEITAQTYLQMLDSPPPILSPDEVDDETGVTEEQVERLRAAGVTHVRTKDFAWPFWWVFVISAIGLGAGSLLVRTSSRRDQAAGVVHADAVSPEAAIKGLIDDIASLRDELDQATNDDARQQLLLQRISAAQQTHVEAFVAAGTALSTRLGLGRYAEVMDHFAAAERQLNRAWSAAADHVLDEATDCIGRLPIMLLDVQERLGS